MRALASSSSPPSSPRRAATSRIKIPDTGGSSDNGSSTSVTVPPSSASNADADADAESLFILVACSSSTLLLTHAVFPTKAVRNTAMPTACSEVHRLSEKAAKLTNSVAAFRAVDVMDMDRAPNRLVMAPAHDEPKRPVVTNSARITALRGAVQDGPSLGKRPDSISGIVPGSSKKCWRPGTSSPDAWAARAVTRKDME